MGWNSIATKAAAEEYGKQNWRRYAARRRAVVWLVAGAAALAGLWWLARAAVDVAGRADVHVGSLPHPSGGWLAGLAAAAFVAVALRVTARVRRPYRLPRRRVRYRRYR